MRPTKKELVLRWRRSLRAGSVLLSRWRTSLRAGSVLPGREQPASGFTLVELAVVLVVAGVLASIAIPNFITMAVRAKESRVKKNCHCVQLAVELYATGTTGIYPDANEASIVNNIVPLISGQQRLENPFTNARTEPVVGPAALPGQTGYEATNVAGVNIGYVITGFGRTQTVLTQKSGQ